MPDPAAYKRNLCRQLGIPLNSNPQITGGGGGGTSISASAAEFPTERLQQGGGGGGDPRKHLSVSGLSIADQMNVPKEHFEYRGGRLVRGAEGAFAEAIVFLNEGLKDRPYVAGDEMSLADIRIGFEVSQIEAEKLLKYARYGQMRYDLVAVQDRLPTQIEQWMGRLNAQLPHFSDAYGMMNIHSKIFDAQRLHFLAEKEGASKGGDGDVTREWTKTNIFSVRSIDHRE